MADVLKRVPVREQDPQVRAKNFDEVCLGYNAEEAVEEANRCIGCKNAKCVQGCPVSIDIPAFIDKVKGGWFEEAYQIIGQSSALQAICGRVCPQESQCEGKCIRGIKGDPVSIGKLERFVADWACENGIKPKAAAEKNGHKVAVIGKILFEILLLLHKLFFKTVKLRPVYKMTHSDYADSRFSCVSHNKKSFILSCTLSANSLQKKNHP